MAGTPPTFDSRITRVEQTLSRVEGQISTLLSEFCDMKEKVDAILTRLDDHQSVLYGDHGKAGLVSQAEILDELNAALKGVGREPGLVADIKGLSTKMNDLDDNRKWLTRLIVAAMIADAISRFVQLGPK